MGVLRSNISHLTVRLQLQGCKTEYAEVGFRRAFIALHHFMVVRSRTASYKVDLKVWGKEEMPKAETRTRKGKKGP